MNLIPGLTPAVTTQEHVQPVGVHIVFVKHQEVWLHLHYHILCHGFQMTLD